MADEEWSTNSTEATSVVFWQPDADEDEPRALHTMQPDFTYPIFGEEESIFGYKDLQISINFTAHDLRPCVTWQYDKKFKTIGSTEALDLQETLADFVPEGCFASSLSAFHRKLQDEDSSDFRPPGEKVREWRQGGGGGRKGGGGGGGKQFEIWAGQLSDPRVRALVERIQVLVPLFIEGGTELQLHDQDWTISRWRVFFLYGKLAEPPTPTGSRYSFIGYCTTYRFVTLEPKLWALAGDGGGGSGGEPHARAETGEEEENRDERRRVKREEGGGTSKVAETEQRKESKHKGREGKQQQPKQQQQQKDGDKKQDQSTELMSSSRLDLDVLSLPYRGRISQFLILPAHAHQGHGSMLYATVFRHFHDDPSCVEITVEDPNEAFDDLRDYCDFTRLLQDGTLERIRMEHSPDPKLFSHTKQRTKDSGSAGSSNPVARGRMPTDALVSKPLLADVRRSSKLAARQFRRLIELWLLSRVPASARQSGLARLTRRANTRDDGDRAFYFWRLLVKQRIYNQNRDRLRELEQSEAVKHLEDTVDNVLADYERLLASLAEKAIKASAAAAAAAASSSSSGGGSGGGEEEVAASSSSATGAQNRKRGRRNLVVEDDDDDEEEDKDGDGRGKRQKSVADA